MKWMIAAACVAAFHASVDAQTLRPMLTYETAAKMRDACFAFARDRKLEVAIAVHDEAGRMVTFARTDGASTAVTDIAIWKSRSAAGFRIASSETAKWNQAAMPWLATAGGGVPLFSTDGQALGGIGVSGAQTEDDIACAEAAIRAAGLRSNRP